MPEKFNSKHLSYASQPPPFLAALQAQAAGHGGPDPIAAGRRRPGKKRSDSEEAEDVPLVVDERGNVVALAVDKDGGVVAAEQQHDDVPEKENGKGKKDSEDRDRKEAEVNGNMSIGGRKRKAGRVVGGEEDEEQDGMGGVVEGRSGKGDKKHKMGPKKLKKKAKVIKLSFDED
ncbi:hypothetical protein A9K55_006749 [Cordyceps militaris]|uniref:DUF4604 domain-containing protein n=1 Tax=Cordyceps militaris TaxID=73501 RepID=A0A2H4SDS1_CORMI|nr:hypothetical protein A9K55_006749 [Cordyceps militaris]